MTITFDRPDKFNAFNRELAMGVQEALRIAATDAAGGQLVMAKVTGNFKRGNERDGKSRAHET